MNQELKAISNLYETDFALWIEQTSLLLRSGNYEEVDWENLIEEIEGLVKSDKRALRSQIERVMMHFLKWDYQPERRSRSWRNSVAEGQNQIHQLLQDSPSLKPYLVEVLPECYRVAIKLASIQTNLPRERFATECPYSVNAVMTRELPWE